MIQAATHGKGRANLTKALSERLDFKTSGSLKGERTNRIVHSTGYLNAEERQTLKDHESGDGVVYVVTSYSTPIAWVTSTGHVHRVAQKFSVTTSKHQGFLHYL